MALRPLETLVSISRETGERAIVFFDGAYRTSDPGPFPFAFTLGCLEIELPLGIAR